MCVDGIMISFCFGGVYVCRCFYITFSYLNYIWHIFCLNEFVCPLSVSRYCRHSFFFLDWISLRSHVPTVNGRAGSG
jgi:hypothetical protein